MISRNKKRGSLALSMNAIVILIMAIAMLGVGLGIINLVRQKAFAGIEEIEVMPDKIATAGSPIAAPGTIVVTSGDSKSFGVSVYNANINPQLFTLDPTECVGAGETTITLTPVPMTTTIPAQSQTMFGVLVDASDASPGTTLCTMTASVTGGITLRTPITIKVQ